MIYVTHDQVEAMTLADKIVVLDHGVISQIGTPMDLYHRPANKFVASFIGSPTMNFLPAEARSTQGNEAVIGLPGGHEFKLTTRGDVTKGSSGYELGIRPEHIRLGNAGDPNANLDGKVQILERLGNATIMYVDTPAGQIVVHNDGDVPTKAGDAVGGHAGPGHRRTCSRPTRRPSRPERLQETKSPRRTPAGFFVGAGRQPAPLSPARVHAHSGERRVGRSSHEARPRAARSVEDATGGQASRLVTCPWSTTVASAKKCARPVQRAAATNGTGACARSRGSRLGLRRRAGPRAVADDVAAITSRRSFESAA